MNNNSLNKKRLNKNFRNSSFYGGYMIPAYFPLTFLSKKEIERINSFVGEFAVYQPSFTLISPFFLEMKKKKKIHILNPSFNCERKTTNFLKFFFNLISNNFYDQYSDTELLKSNLDEIPFYNDDTISAIVKIIKKNRIDYRNFGVKKIVYNLNAFLALAHKNDFDRHWSYSEIEKSNINEKKIFNSLSASFAKKDKVNFKKVTKYYNEIFNSNFFYLKNRIKAWSFLMLFQINFPCFLITNLSFIFKYILTAIKSIYSFDNKILYFNLTFKKNTHNISTEILKDIEKLSFSKNITGSTINSLTNFVISNNFFCFDKKMPILLVIPGISLKNFLEKLSGFNSLIRTKKCNWNSFNTVMFLIN